MYLCDTTTPGATRKQALEAIGSDRRQATEMAAKELLVLGKKGHARRLVPWRDPDVWATLDKFPCEIRWGKAHMAP